MPVITTKIAIETNYFNIGVERVRPTVVVNGIPERRSSENLCIRPLFRGNGISERYSMMIRVSGRLVNPDKHTGDWGVRINEVPLKLCPNRKCICFIWKTQCDLEHNHLIVIGDKRGRKGTKGDKREQKGTKQSNQKTNGNGVVILVSTAHCRDASGIIAKSC